MAVPEFTYFIPVKARGEPARIAFHASGEGWKDTSVSFDDFKAGKAEGKYPTGLPTLKLPSGKVITQSVAIARYAGKLGKSGLYPADPEAAVVVDAAMDIAQDALTKCPQDPDEAVKKTKREEYAATRLKSFMEQLNTMIESSGGPFLLGESLSIADLVITYFVCDMIEGGTFDYVPSDYLKQFSKLGTFSEAVKKHAVVTAYDASKA